MPHRFKTGQVVVRTQAERDGRDKHEIVRLLPQLPNGELQYRIKEVATGVERVVREAEIKRI
jgi:hypothetical protein